MFCEALARLADGRFWIGMPVPVTLEDQETTLRKVAAYAKRVAHNVMVDALEERRKRYAAESAVAPLDRGAQTRSTTEEDQEPRRRLVSDSEETALEILDALRHPESIVEDEEGELVMRVPLTAPFEREEFWKGVREWAAKRCRGRFGRTLHFLNVSRRRLSTLVVDGRALAPEEAVWIRLLNTNRCPADLAVFSNTPPDEVFALEYEAIKKAIKRSKCPPKSYGSGDSKDGYGHESSTPKDGCGVHDPQRGFCRQASPGLVRAGGRPSLSPGGREPGDADPRCGWSGDSDR
jgi:hypothetical protein